MVAANHLLYKPIAADPAGEKAIAKGQKKRDTEHPDHCVVIKVRLILPYRTVSNLMKLTDRAHLVVHARCR